MNKLIIAGAGTGKTRYLINNALTVKDKVLITTFTINCKDEIERKIIDQVGYVPNHIRVQTWFSMLLQHAIKPYKRALKIGKIRGIKMEEGISAIRYRNKDGIPICWKEKINFFKHYFTPDCRIYTDKLSKLAIRLDDETKGKVINRISSIFKYIFIDEVQDMAGYDLEFIKRIMNTNSNVILVGDPRQTIYKTHFERKFKKYSYGNIKEFIENECKSIECKIDNTELNTCYRCHKDIISFVNKFYNEYPPMEYTEIKKDCHQGVFVIKKSPIEEYIRKYRPVQLINDSSVITSELSPKITFGKSKGATYSRVLLYPTEEFKKYIVEGKANLKIGTKNKMYVGMTRPINSLTFVIDEDTNAFKLMNGL